MMNCKLEVTKLMEKRLGFPEQIQGLTLSMLELDEDRFEKILGTNILQIGFERTMMNLIYPFFPEDRDSVADWFNLTCARTFYFQSYSPEDNCGHRWPGC
jgi:hypothetical protein